MSLQGHSESSDKEQPLLKGEPRGSLGRAPAAQAAEGGTPDSKELGVSRAGRRRTGREV